MIQLRLRWALQMFKTETFASSFFFFPKKNFSITWKSWLKQIFNKKIAMEAYFNFLEMFSLLPKNKPELIYEYKNNYNRDSFIECENDQLFA